MLVWLSVHDEDLLKRQSDDVRKESTMVETLSRYWWAVVLRGIAAILFGAVALVWPGATVFALVVLFGAYALVDGVFTLASALGRNRDGVRTGSRSWLIVQGIAGVLMGILTFVWPDATALVLLWLIAAWALITGVLQVAAAIRLHREMRHEWLLALSGVLSVAFGILLLVWPAAGALAVVTLIGAYAVVFGIALAVLGVRLHRNRPDARAATGTRNRPAPA
ncbi:HdeD family acid-resistance protein [Krasilnikovia sp. M28-CT-15]|uniref:HdeD family acid-resistance protein n=1 Tax=Krasilnikovia sp. M28-CT-15 TaxID=3373540 RepID=UPI003876AD96